MQAFSKPQLSRKGQARKPFYRVMVIRYTPGPGGKFKTHNKTRSLMPGDTAEENLSLDIMLNAAVEAVLGLTESKQAV